MNTVLGQHLLVEYYNCNQETLDDVAGIERHMNEAALACGATIVQSTFHRFQPWGVSGVVVIAESHLAIHTWPEYGYASVDLYTCGEDIQPDAAYHYLKAALQSEITETQMLKRGNLDLIKARLEARLGDNTDQRQAISAGISIPTPEVMKGGAV